MNKHRSHQQDERRQAEYWKRRALEAEARVRELEPLERAQSARDALRVMRAMAQPSPVLDWGGVKCDDCMSRFCECAK